MKIGILSDSHDNLANLEKAINYLNEQNIKRMIFCGDFCSPIPVKTQLSRFGGEIDAVFGNTEDRHLITKLSLTEVKSLNIHGELAKLEIDGLKIAVTHYPDYAEALAKTGDFDLVCHGHTHTAREEMFENTKLINPGEIMGFKEGARFVVFNTDTKEVETIFVRDIDGNKIEITVQSNLTDKLKAVDRSINDDAFADLLDLPKDIQDDIDEKFIITPWRYLFAQIDDTYVGRVILDKREIEIKGNRYEIVGINGLAVRSSHQQLGIGKKIMNEAIALCKKEDIDAIFLNAGEELHEYYRNFGFVMRSYDFVGKSGKAYLEDDGMILVLNEDTEEILLSNKFNVGQGNV